MNSLPSGVYMGQSRGLVHGLWGGWVACAGGWWPNGDQKDQEVSESTLHVHRGEMKDRPSVWSWGPAPGGPSCRKGSPRPNQIPQENPSQAQGSGKPPDT